MIRTFRRRRRAEMIPCWMFNAAKPQNIKISRSTKTTPDLEPYDSALGCASATAPMELVEVPKIRDPWQEQSHAN